MDGRVEVGRGVCPEQREQGRAMIDKKRARRMDITENRRRKVMHEEKGSDDNVVWGR
jgi:hypothetical protein